MPSKAEDGVVNLGPIPDTTAELLPYLAKLYSPSELTQLIVDNRVDEARVLAGKIECVSELTVLYAEQLEDARKGDDASGK